jgi:hypothetical protein
MIRGRSVADLHAVVREQCHSLGLGDGSGKWENVIGDLCVLAAEPTGASLQNVGSGDLHRFLYFNLEPVPVMNLIVELSFSCLKTTEKTNSSSETTDMSMATKMEIFHPARVGRLGMKRDDGKDYVAPQHLDNFKQCQHWARHCAEVGRRYMTHAMVNVPVLNQFRKQRTSNINSKGNKVFVSKGKSLRQSRVRRGTTLSLAKEATKVMAMDIADDVLKLRVQSISTEAVHVKDCLLVPGHWDRSYTTPTEKKHCRRPFSVLVAPAPSPHTCKRHAAEEVHAAMAGHFETCATVSWKTNSCEV